MAWYYKVIPNEDMVQDDKEPRLYDSIRWRKARALFLRKHPLCVFCKQSGRTTRADTVDHITPHNGDHDLFWDENNWQPLCASCHSGRKRTIDHRGYSQACDTQGNPTDVNHPWNRGSGRGWCKSS